MVHSDRPLQEKMTLFWHNHFATAYTKIAGTLGAAEGDALHGGEAVGGSGRVRGQIEMLRDNALGNFRDILVEHRQGHGDARLARRPRPTRRRRPQENFGREIMELFTMGVGHYTEADVYAAARVFTGWNLARPGAAADGTQHYEFVYNADQHDTAAKTFSFPIYRDGGKTIPARAAADGMQDGLDLIDALAASPTRRATSRPSCIASSSPSSATSTTRSSNRIANVYLQSRYDMKAVMREVLLSPEFWDRDAYFARYSWPVEFVVRALKDIGWTGFSVNDALTPLSNMGQTLYDPPDVAGWDLGPGVVLDRLDAGAHELRVDAGGQSASSTCATAAGANARGTPEALLSYVLDALRHGAARRRRHGGAVDLPARDRRRGPAATRSCRPRWPASFTWWPAPRSTSSYEGHQTQFVKGGVAAFTVTFAAPEFLCDLARAQGARVRNLVVLYLSGGNDALSMLIPYNDPFYYSRRPTIAVPAGNVLQIGTDCSRVALGLHPRLTGLKQIFDQGRLALIQRTGYPNQSRSHFLGTDIWSTADPSNSAGLGWVGRYLDSLPSPVDPLVGWNTTRRVCRACCSRAHVRCRRSPTPPATRSRARTRGAEAAAERNDRAAHQLARAGRSARAGVRLRQRAGGDGDARPRRHGRDLRPAPSPIPNTGFAQALQAVAGAMVRGDRHAGLLRHDRRLRHALGAERQRRDGAYYNLMATLNDGLIAFYNDLKNQGLLEDTLVLTFSEFGRRITENGSHGTDHGAASVMMAMGGRVNGGLYGTAPVLNPDPAKPDARKQRRRRPLRDRLPLGLRPGHRQLAGRRLARDPGRRLPQARPRVHLRLGSRPC